MIISPANAATLENNRPCPGACAHDRCAAIHQIAETECTCGEPIGYNRRYVVTAHGPVHEECLHCDPPPAPPAVIMEGPLYNTFDEYYEANRIPRT